MKILILGATSDIAMAIATEFAKHKFDVLLAARDSTRMIPFSKDLKIRYGIETSIIEFDVLDYPSHKSFREKLPNTIDIVVSAFGYLGDQEDGELNWVEAEKIINTNFTGAVSILNQMAIYFSKLGKGSIIGISSVAGDRGRGSNYLYGSAKAGFSTYLSGLRNKLSGKKINVITVKPGFVATKMTDHLDLPKPITNTAEQIAKLVYQAYLKNKSVVYPVYWKWIMLIIKLIPESIFKRLKL